MTKTKTKRERKPTKALAKSTQKPTQAAPKPKRSAKRSPTPEVEVIPSACPKCGSTNHAGYNSTKERDIAGTLRDGRTYRRIVWKRTKCLDCDQNRVDVYYLNT